MNASRSIKARSATGRVPRMQLLGMIAKPRTAVEDEREVRVYRYLLIVINNYVLESEK